MSDGALPTLVAQILGAVALSAGVKAVASGFWREGGSAICRRICVYTHSRINTFCVCTRQWCQRGASTGHSGVSAGFERMLHVLFSA